MKIHFRAEAVSTKQVTFGVIIDGERAGTVVMTLEEAAALCNALATVAPTLTPAVAISIDATAWLIRPADKE